MLNLFLNVLWDLKLDLWKLSKTIFWDILVGWNSSALFMNYSTTNKSSLRNNYKLPRFTINLSLNKYDHLVCIARNIWNNNCIYSLAIFFSLIMQCIFSTSFVKKFNILLFPFLVCSKHNYCRSMRSLILKIPTLKL